MGAAEKLPELYTEEEAARYLGVSEVTLRRFRKQKELVTSESQKLRNIPNTTYLNTWNNTHASPLPHWRILARTAKRINGLV